jgi:hypothetical protein
MSGSNYTLTPNLGLYKPIANADINQWGSHLNLNADVLDTLWGGTGGIGAPLYWTATGSTASRSAQDRSADRMNVRDFGAKMDGTNDTTAFLAAYNAAPTDGTVYVPPGTWNVDTAGFVRGAGTGNIRFMVEGNAGLQQYIGDGDIVETMLVGRKGFYKQMTTSSNGFATVQVGMINNNPTSFSQPTVVSGLVVGASSFTGSSGYTWSHNVNLESYGGIGGAPNSTQDVSIASRVHKFGYAATWQFFGSSQDNTGLDATATGNIVGWESDIIANGPEDPATAYDPHQGGRVAINFANRANTPAAWLANHAYGVASNGTATAVGLVQPTVANGFVYRCIVAGTTGSTQPTWPTTVGATVADGTVTWECHTLAMQFSRLINAAAAASTTYGAFLYSSAAYYDAILEFSTATLVDGGVKDAGIRLAANMPIDFSGDGTAAGQNNHILQYRSATQRLYYTVAGVDMWSVDASGNVRARGTVTGSTTP